MTPLRQRMVEDMCVRNPRPIPSVRTCGQHFREALRPFPGDAETR